MKSWKRSIVANIVGKVSVVVFSLLFTPLYVHILGIEAFSLVAFYTSLLALNYLLDMTFGATMTRALAQAKFNPHGPDDLRDLARSLEIFYLASSGIVAASLVLAAPWIATKWLNVEHLQISIVTTSVALMGISVALQAPMTVYVGGLYGLERQSLVNALSAGQGAIRGFGAVAAITLIAPSPIVFFTWQLVFGVVSLVCFAVVFWRKMPAGTRRPRFSRTALGRVAKFASGMAATGVVTFFLSQINTILLSKLLPLPRLGIFQIANQVNLATRIMGSPIESAILPRLSYHAGADDQPALARTYHEACQIVALLVLPASTILLFFCTDLINIWMSNRHIAAEAGPVASILVAGSTLNNLMRVPYRVTVAKGWSMYGFYQNLIAVVIYLPLLIYLAISFGMMGVAWSWLILNTVMLLSSSPILHQRMLPGEFWRWAVVDIFVPLAVSLGGALLLYAFVPSHLPKLGLLAALFAGWMINFLVCAAVMPHTRDLLQMVSRRILFRVVHA